MTRNASYFLLLAKGTMSHRHIKQQRKQYSLNYSIEWKLLITYTDVKSGINSLRSIKLLTFFTANFVSLSIITVFKTILFLFLTKKFPTKFFIAPSSEE